MSRGRPVNSRQCLAPATDRELGSGHARPRPGTAAAAEEEHTGVGVSGVAAVTILVTDLARSTRWYCDVLDLVFIREFAVDGSLWGVPLLDTDANFVSVLQDKGTTPGVQDMRGTRPVVLAVPSGASVDNMVERLRGMGLGPVRVGHVHDGPVRVGHRPSGPGRAGGDAGLPRPRAARGCCRH
ncbi:VOC family protein [Streptomyces sp. NPDC059389]|uniref:VOC family protein n=1 Tax=Streptomyces sp. NPDC059389 TaxID=3346818 RepID=UPI0036CF6A48